MDSKTYLPRPVDTTGIVLDDDLDELCEALAKNAHETWAKQRMAEGWSHGAARDDAAKKHPCLVPYEELPENEKEYDRIMVRETLRTIVTLGFSIAKK